MSAAKTNVSLTCKNQLMLIQNLLTLAHQEFKKLPNDIQDQLADIHHEGTDIRHCLRWGENSIDYIVDGIIDKSIILHTDTTNDSFGM